MSEPASEMISTAEPASEMTSTAEPASEMTSTAEPASEMTSTAEPASEMTSTAGPGGRTPGTAGPASETAGTAGPGGQTPGAAGPGSETAGTAEPAGDLTGTGDPAVPGRPGGGSATPDEVVIEADPTPTLEDIIGDLEVVTAQRDEYLALAQARQAEFENFRKRTMKQQADDVSRATGRVVEELLPVLDAFDDGLRHGIEGLVPVRAQLLGVLERQGLERLDPTDQAFDPNEHDAVAHEPGEDGTQVVSETMRAGYRWQGRVLRPAMVKVRG